MGHHNIIFLQLPQQNGSTNLPFLPGPTIHQARTLSSARASGDPRAVSGGGSAPRAAKRSRREGAAPPGEVTSKVRWQKGIKLQCWFIYIISYNPPIVMYKYGVHVYAYIIYCVCVHINDKPRYLRKLCRPLCGGQLGSFSAHDHVHIYMLPVVYRQLPCFFI